MMLWLIHNFNRCLNIHTVKINWYAVNFGRNGVLCDYVNDAAMT